MGEILHLTTARPGVLLTFIQSIVRIWHGPANGLPGASVSTENGSRWVATGTLARARAAGVGRHVTRALRRCVRGSGAPERSAASSVHLRTNIATRAGARAAHAGRQPAGGDAGVATEALHDP